MGEDNIPPKLIKIADEFFCRTIHWNHQILFQYKHFLWPSKKSLSNTGW